MGVGGVGWQAAPRGGVGPPTPTLMCQGDTSVGGGSEDKGGGCVCVCVCVCVHACVCSLRVSVCELAGGVGGGWVGLGAHWAGVVLGGGRGVSGGLTACPAAPPSTAGQRQPPPPPRPAAAPPSGVRGGPGRLWLLLPLPGGGPRWGVVLGCPLQWRCWMPFGHTHTHARTHARPPALPTAAASPPSLRLPPGRPPPPPCC